MQNANIESAQEQRLRHVHKLNRLFLKVDTRLSAISPQTQAPRRIATHTMRRRSEMYARDARAQAGPSYEPTPNITRQGETLRNPESRIYHLNKAPGANILTRAKLQYVDQNGWKYWLCSEFPHFVSPLEQMIPQPATQSRQNSDPSHDASSSEKSPASSASANSQELRQQRQGYLSCFARPPTEAETNSASIRTPEAGQQLVLTHVKDNHQLAVRVIESSSDLDHAPAAGSRKSRCVLMQIV
jgi:hypothetical protein